MTTSPVPELDMTIKCQSPLKLYYYQLPDAISDISNTTASNCDNIMRYSRSKLFDLRNETNSRRRPEYDLRAELQSLGVWKFNASGNGLQNSAGSNNEGTAVSCNAYVANHTAQLSSGNLNVRAQRSPGSRETTLNNSNSSQHNTSYHNLHKTYIDHRSISSSHLMPAFAKRRNAASSAPSSNAAVVGSQNLSSSGNSSYGPNSPVDTRSQTPTEVKDGLFYSNISGENNGNMRQRNKDQLYDCRQRGNSGGPITGDEPNIFISPQRKVLDQDRERDKEQELQSDSRRLSSPMSLGLCRYSHNNGGIAQERRIGSGRLLPRDVNWDYRASQDRDKGQSLSSAPIQDKEVLAANHVGQARGGGRYSERTSVGNGYSDRRHLERRSGGDNDSVRDKYEYVSNAQTPNPHGGGTRRDIYGADSSSNQHSISHNRNRRNQKYDRNEEPEWFSSGPTSQHDTIELRGFEEIDDQYNESSKEGIGSTKRTHYSNSSRKISESSSSRESSTLNLSSTKAKQQLHLLLDQENGAHKTLTLSPGTLPSGNNIISFENIDSLREKDGLKVLKENSESKNNAKRLGRSDEAVDATLPDFMLETEEISKKSNTSRDSEFNFDVFLNPNLDPLKHSLMRGDNSNNENEEIGSSRFSRWFANKTVGNEGQLGNCNANNTAMDLIGSDTKHESNTLMEFLNKLPALPDSVITQKVTAITSVEELEARMGVMNTTNEVLPEAHHVDMPNKNDEERVLDMIPSIANEQLISEHPQAGEIEAFKKVLEQLGHGNKQLQQQHNQTQQQVLPHNLQSNVLISPKHRSDSMSPLNIMQTGAPPNLSQQIIVKNDELKKILLSQGYHQQHQSNEEINILSQSQPQPIPLTALFGNHPQKRIEQNLFQGIQRGVVSINFLEQQLNNPNMSPSIKEAIATVLRDASTMATLHSNVPHNQQNYRPIGHQQQISAIRNSSGSILHQGPSNSPIQPPQQQQILQQIQNVMVPGQRERITLLPHQASNHQAIPSQREMQFHTHPIMQNATLKKKIEEQQDSIIRRQENHPPSNNTLGLNKVDTQQSNIQQMQISSNMQQQTAGTQQQAQPTRHINSPTPLAFTPTSVLRKMTAEKDNSNSNPTTLHHNMLNSVIQQQNKAMAQNTFINPTNNQHQMQQPTSTLPRMILGGNNTQQQQQQMSNNNSLPPQSLNPTPQQQAVQPLRNSMAPIKWPLHLVNQSITAIKSMGRPILKAPLPPQSGNHPDHGVKKGDRVSIYMPMILELPIAMLACARIGAVHSIVFAGFSSDSLAERMFDCQAKVLITADGAWRGEKPLYLKALCDVALEKVEEMGHTVEKCIVVSHLKRVTPCADDHVEQDIPWTEDRDFWWHEEMEDKEPACYPEWMEAEDPLFMLYTSGSTGKPKGVLHTTAGYLLYAATTFKIVFDYKPGDIYWCTADIGWITGHTYVVYGPLANGATSVMFEGTPFYPDNDRFWAVIDKYKVTQFYTAPTAIRALMKFGEAPVLKHNLNGLKVLGSVGEPINPEAWLWFYRYIGKEKCSIVDTFWQTETGGHVITPIPGATPMKPGSASFPFFGVKPTLLDESGVEIKGEGEGYLVFSQPWPGMMRTLFGNHERFESTYFSKFPGFYCTGDGARRDADGYLWITGRVDDMLNVSGHLMSTAEVESVLTEHHRVAEAAVVSRPHTVKGECLYCFITPNENETFDAKLVSELKKLVRERIGPFAMPDVVQHAPGLPKTRSGKIMRRVLRKVALNDRNVGDISTLADESIVDQLFKNRPAEK